MNSAQHRKWTPAPVTITRPTRVGSAIPSILGEAGGRLDHATEKIFDPNAGGMAVVRGRRLQYLLERRRRHVMKGRGAPAIIYDSPLADRNALRLSRLQVRRSARAILLISASRRAIASSYTCPWCRKR
jgi:hypothetical protein